MSEYDIAIKIAGKLEGSFRTALAGAQQGLSGLGVSGKVGSLALRGVEAAARATAVGLAAAGAGIAAVGTYAVNVGKDFEAQMSTVAAISGATGSEFEALTNKAKEMGAKTSFSATEAGQAFEYMAMAGWKTDDMLAGVEGIMNLAAASGEELATVSDIVTDALTAFGKGADYAGTFADQLAAASANANVNVEMLGESFSYAAPVAGALGFTTADTAEALSLMGNAGIKASQAGTAMRRILNSLTADTLSFATSTGEVTVATQNADGTMRNLSDILDDCRGAFSSMTDAQKAQVAEALVGKNAMSGFLALMNAAPGDIDKVRTALENSAGAAAEMAAIRLDNLEGDITLLKSAAESFGISIYQNMQKPFRSAVQFAKQQIGILQDALDKGGFEGLTKSVGTVLSNGVTLIADKAPDFVEGASAILEALLDGIDNNADKIGESIGKLITALGATLIRLAPRLAVTGIHLLIAIAGGIVDNLGLLKDAAVNAVSYLWESIKGAFKSFANFLGDDEVEPFKKVLALLTSLAGGFVIFDAIGGSIKGFVSDFKSAGKGIQGATKGFTGATSSMSKATKNILGVGAGLALAAAGIWILVNAAKRLADAGPGAVFALLLLSGGIAGFMVLAASLGSKLESAKSGLLAFGGAILMAAAGITILTYAAIELSKAGPLAFGGLIVLVAGIAALMVMASTLGSKLNTATPGLLAFGAAILLAGAGMYVMASAATMLSESGVGAMVMFVVMTAALLAFMVVASALGSTLITAGVGMIILGAGILIAAAGMYLLASAAVMLSDAGVGAVVILVALVAVILLFGVAAGLLAPLLIEGGVALMVFGAGLVVVAAAALLASAALYIISTTLPAFAEYGLSAALGVVALGGALIVLGAGAVVAGMGLLVASVGLAALGVAALVAMIPLVAIGAAFLAVGVAVLLLATFGLKAAEALGSLTGYGLSGIASMTALATALSLPIAPMGAFAVAALGASASLLGAASGVTAIAAALISITASTTVALVSFRLMTTSVTTGMNAMTVSVRAGMTLVTSSVVSGFSLMAMAVRASVLQIIAIANSMGAAIRSAFTRIDLYSSGVDMMRGLLHGMDSMRDRVGQVAREIALTAAQAVNNALQVHSPSKLMMETGQYTAEGLALGMEQGTPRVSGAAEGMVSPISVVANSNTPVGDREVEKGATFNFNPTYVIEGNADRDTLTEVNTLSQREFERMANEWIRNNKRTSFA